MLDLFKSLFTGYSVEGRQVMFLSLHPEHQEFLFVNRKASGDRPFISIPGNIENCKQFIGFCQEVSVKVQVQEEKKTGPCHDKTYTSSRESKRMLTEVRTTKRDRYRTARWNLLEAIENAADILRKAHPDTEVMYRFHEIDLTREPVDCTIAGFAELSEGALMKNLLRKMPGQVKTIVKHHVFEPEEYVEKLVAFIQMANIFQTLIFDDLFFWDEIKLPTEFLWLKKLSLEDLSVWVKYEVTKNTEGFGPFRHSKEFCAILKTRHQCAEIEKKALEQIEEERKRDEEEREKSVDLSDAKKTMDRLKKEREDGEKERRKAEMKEVKAARKKEKERVKKVKERERKDKERRKKAKDAKKAKSGKKAKKKTPNRRYK